MEQKEIQYYHTVQLIAFALLIFCGGFLLLSLVLAVLPMLLAPLLATWREVIQQIVYGVLYAAVFLLPVLYFYRVRRRACPPREIYLKPEMGADAVLYLFAGLAVIAFAALVNARIMEWIDPATAQIDLIGEVAGSNQQLILRFIVLAAIPAFVEELLFRGVILSNLLPYNKGFAVVASGVLFGLMHQNFSQLLYATVAGVVLGYIYVKTRSIWPCVTLHLANNALSVIEAAIFERVSAATATTAYNAIQLFIFTAGILCGTVLAVRANRQRMTARAATESEPNGLHVLTCLRLFFAPAMIIFVVVCLMQAVMSLLISLWL